MVVVLTLVVLCACCPPPFFISTGLSLLLFLVASATYRAVGTMMIAIHILAVQATRNDGELYLANLWFPAAAEDPGQK